MKVLIASADLTLCLEVKSGLETGDFHVQCVTDGDGACRLAMEGKHVAVVLDSQLPILDAWSFCAKLRGARITTPIIMLTSEGCVRERVAGLESGADDCLSRPFDVEELRARLHALVRRDRVVKSTKMAVDDLVVDSAAHVAMRGGQDVRLTQREFTLLKALVAHEGQVLSRAAIQNEVWGDGYSSSNTVDVHVRNLRQKIERNGPRLIHTVFGVGYVLRSNETRKETPDGSGDPPE